MVCTCVVLMPSFALSSCLASPCFCCPSLPAARNPSQPGVQGPYSVSTCLGAQKQALFCCAPQARSSLLDVQHLQSSNDYQGSLCECLYHCSHGFVMPCNVPLLHVSKLTASQNVSSRFCLSAQRAATVPGNALTWHVCLLPHEGHFFVVQLLIPEVKGIPSHACLDCGHVQNASLHCLLCGAGVPPMLGSRWILI